MASWLVHLRIADAFLNRILNISPKEFVIGNIGPDCSQKNSVGKFVPPSEVTHWTPSGRKTDIEYDRFFEERIPNPKNVDYTTSFYLGYYIHLLTDVLWTKMVFRPTKYKFSTEYYKDAFAFLPMVRNDWFGLDHCFFRDNPDFEAIKILGEIESFPNIYFDYYAPDSFDKQIAHVYDFYTKYDGEYKDSYKYLSKEEMDDFVIQAVEIIQDELIRKGVKIII